MPFDPTLSTNPALRKQAAPQIAAQADHERQVLRQQADQKRAEAKAAREAEKMQNKAAKAQQQANIDATHAAQQAQQAEKAKLITQYQQEGRNYKTNPIDGSLTVIDSDATLAARKAKEGEDLRKESLLGQMQSLQAEAALQPGPMRTKERGDLETALKDTHTSAKLSLDTKLREKAKAVTGGNDFIPFNESPAPEAESAKARLDRLMQPDAQLDDTDLADLEADPTTAPTVAKLRTLQQQLDADDEARTSRQQTGQTLKELAIRRADPAKWEAYQREKLAELDGPALDAHLASNAEVLRTRAADLEAKQQALMAPQQQWQQKRSELEQQNQQAKASGIPAGELVTLDDGSTWHRPLAKELFDIQAQSQAHEGDPEVAKQRKLLEIDMAEFNREAKLHQEAAQMRQQKGQAKQEAFHQRLEANPSTAPFSKTLRGLSQEHEARAAVVAEMYPQDSPERQAAMKAIEDDVGTRQQQTQKELQTTVQAKATASAALFEQFGKNPQVNWEKDYGLVQNMTAAAAKLGLSEKEARYWLKFHKTADWSQPLTPEMQPTGWSGALDTLTAPLKKGVSEIISGPEAEKDPARILPDGTLIINPSLHSTQAGYDAAVQASPATPEAKEAAKADFPRLQKQWASQMLPALADEAAIPGLPSFMKWREAHIARDQARKGADGFTRQTPEEHALAYMQEMQARPGWAKYADSLTRRFIKAGGDVGTMFTGAAALTSGWVPGVGQALSELTADWNQENSRLTAALPMKGGMDSLGLRTTGLLTELVPQVGSMIVGGVLLKGGMKTAAAIAGAQSAGLQFAGTYAQRREAGQSHEEAYAATAPFALASGIATALFTAAGGRYGPDALAMSKALRDKAVTETARAAWRQQWPRIAALSTVGTHAGMEVLEELPDELFSQISEALATNPNAKIGDVIADFIAHSPELMLAVGALGGVSGIGEARDAYQPQETTAPDLFPAAYEAVENLGALPGVRPEDVEPMKNRAAVALAIAKGGSVEDMEEWQLNAAGWTGRNSKNQTLPPGQIEALKDYTGPEVLEVDTEGNATISPTYLAALEAYLPAAHAAIVGAAPSSSPTQASSQSPSPQVSGAAVSPSSSVSPAPADSAQKPAAPTGTPDTQQPRGSSGQGPAPATVDAGGEPQAGAGAVSSAPAAGSMQEARAQALAVILEERGLTPEQAQAAAQHVVSRQGVQGATAEAQYAAGIDDAMREKNWIRGSGKKYTFVPPTPDAQPETVSPPVASQNEAKRYSEESIAQMSDEELAAAAKELAANLSEWEKDDGMSMQTKVKGFGAAGAIKREQERRAAKATDKESLSVASDATPPAAPAPVSESPAQPSPSPQVSDAAVSPLTTPHGPALAARLLKDGTADTLEEAQALVAEYEKKFGKQQRSVEGYIQGLRSKLDPTTYAAHQKHFFQWLAEKETADNGGKLRKGRTAPPASATAAPPVSQSPAQPSPTPAPATLRTPDRASALRTHQAWARHRLYALSALPPAERPAARRILAAVERGVAENHALFKGLALGRIARNITGGQGMAVKEVGGKVVLALDLPGLITQFSNVKDVEGGVLASMVEESIHAAVLGLAKLNPERYGFDAFVRQWQRLPAALRLKVWKAYKGVDIQSGTAQKLPTRLTQDQQWQMHHEFVRMLVQDKYFAQQISEVAAQDKSLATWLVQILTDLSASLKKLLGLVSPDLRAELETMVDEIGSVMQSMQQASAEYQDRLSTLRTVDNPQGRAVQHLTDGTLYAALAPNDPAFQESTLAALFDQLPPALQALAAESRPVPGQKVKKATLMHQLLSALALEPGLAQSLFTTPATPPKATNILRRLYKRLEAQFSAPPPPSLSDLLQATPAEARAALQHLHTQVQGALRNLHDIARGTAPTYTPPAAPEPTPAAPPANSQQPPKPKLDLSTRPEDDEIDLSSTTDNRASVLSSSPSPQVSGAAVSKSVKGSTGTAYTDANEPIEYQWAVVDVNDLNISNRDDGTISPDYPQELQPRDRTSAGSEAQVADIAKNFNLDRLSISSSVGDGAPIIGPDGVVESGNGRVMGGRRAYATGNAASSKYRDALISRAGEFGLNAEQVEAVKNPVLVRVRTTEVNRIAFVLAANVSTIAPKRELEQAKIDAKQIVPGLFTNFVPSEDGDVFTAANAAFIRDFVSAIIPPAERPAIMDARGNLSQSGLRRLRNALFVHAYGDSADTLAALGTIAEDIEADGRNLVNTLIAIAPRFAEQNGRIASGALYPLSITEDLAKALTTYQEIKARGDTVDAWAAQDTLAGIGERPSDFQRTLVTALHEHRRKPRVLLAALDRYAKAIDGAGDPKQASLFGEEPRPTREELFALATGKTFTQEEAEGWRKLAEAEALANKNRPTGGQASGAGAVGNVTPAEGSISPVTDASVPQPVPQSSQKSSTQAPADVPRPPTNQEPGTRNQERPQGRPLSTSEAAKAIQAKTGLTDRDALAKELERKLSLRPFAAQSMAEAVLNDLAGTPTYRGPVSRRFGSPEALAESDANFARLRAQFEADRANGVPQRQTGDWMPEDEYRRYAGGRFRSNEQAFRSLAKGTVAPTRANPVTPIGNGYEVYLSSSGSYELYSPTRLVSVHRTFEDAVNSVSPSLPLSSSPSLPSIAPKNALKLYRTLTEKQKAAPLNVGQSKALEQAERSLGQLFLFDDPTTSILKPAEDLVLEQETVNREPRTEQLRLFMGKKAVTEFRAALDQVNTAADTLERELTPEFRAAVAESLRTGQTPRYPVPAGLPPPMPSPGLDRANRIIEARFFQQIFTDPGKAQSAYLRLAQADFGNPRYLNADLARSVFPDYAQHAWFRTAFDGGTVAPAGYITLGLLYPRFLKQRKNASLNNVVLLAGGPSSGKTTVADLLLKPMTASAVAIVDSVMGSPGGAAYLINSALQAGIRPTVSFIYRPFENAALHALKRLVKTGRPVNVEATAKLHVGAQKTFLEASQTRPDVTWKVLVNDGALSDIREEPLDFLREKAYHIADENAAETLARSYGELVEREFDYAGLTPSQYAAARWGRVVLENLREIESRDEGRRSQNRQADPAAESLVNQTGPALQKGRTAPNQEPGTRNQEPDLFSFNTGLGLDTLLTPAQKERKLADSQQLSLFDEPGPRTNAGAQRPEKTRRVPRQAGAARQPAGPESLPDDLFSFGDSGARVSASRFPGELGLGDERAGGGDIGDGVPGPTDQGTTDKPADSVQGDPPGLSLAPAVIPTPADPADRNHRIDGSVAPKGNKAKLEANFAAMKLVRELEAEGRNPSPEEKKTLEAYTGWGWMKEAFNTVRAQKVADMKTRAERYINAPRPYYDRKSYNSWRDYYTDPSEEEQRLLNWADTYLETHERLRAELSEKEFHAAEKSTLNAHFTTPSIISSMWDAIAKLGFKGGRAMEPGGGIGHFIGVQPEDLASRTQWEATELDDVTARILAKLYPQARVNSAMSAPNREVSGMGFQNARIPNNSLDLFISNVPFAKQGPGKAKSEFGQDFNLHNYFFARALSKVKPGGLIAFITTANTMESTRAQRDYLNNHGQLVAAVRLPNNAFKENAGTEVTTDIIILRKPDGTDFVGEPWRERIKVGEDVVTAKRKREGSNAQRIDDWLGEIDPEWIPADEALVEPFTAWMRGGRPASGQKRTALMNALNQLHGFSPMKLDFRAPIYVNEYFARHPENVLGTNRLIGSMYGPGEYTVLPSTEPLESQLAQFVDRLPEDIMNQTATTGFEAKAAERGDKVDSYVEREGRIYQVTKEGLEPVEWQVMPGMDAKAKAAAEKKTAIYTQWAKLREAAVALVQMEANPLADEAEMKAARALLNQVYDRTVEKYGPLSKRRRNNYRFLEDDPEAALLEALEDEDRSTDKAGKVTYTYTKTDIFRRRLIEPQEAPTTAVDLEEAVSISMAWQGTVNPQYVGDLLGTDAGLARQQLIEGGHAFEDPASGMLMTADEYLSGPVSDRLRRAIEAAKDSPQYERNVRALREALPPHKAISEASVILGQRWIPDSIYTAFARHIGMEDGTVRFVPELNSFETRGEGSAEDWIVGNKGAKDILDAVLNNDTLTYRRYEHGEGMVVDEELTASLRVKASEMRDAFSQFVKTTEEKVPDTEFEGQQIGIPDLAERDFNQKVNGIKPPNFVGDWVKLPGQSGIIWLKPFRKAVLARLITQGRGMMAHGVGSGKTYNQIALAMELRRLGKARKPVIVVQNSTINQFAASFRKAYPQAKILVATPRSYNAKTRARFTARMATGDWDAIIMTHSNVDLIGHSEETVTAYFAKELEELDAALLSSDGSDQQSDLQKARDKLIEKRDEMMQALGDRQDDTLNWENIGVDALIVDEAHAFKNAPVVTNRGRDIKNIPSSGVGSQRAVSMMMKTRSVRERNGQKGVFFATGTPVSNSMAEAFIMLRYIAPDLLEANGIRNFDDFASQYGDIVSQAESTWDGKVKMVDRFAKFVNGQQLINLVRSVFDVAMGNESLGIDVPTVRDGKPKQLVVPATAANAAFNSWILREVSPAWERITRKDIKDNPSLSAVPIMTMQAGIAAALDPRLIHDNAPDDPNSKVNTAIKEVLRIYKEGKDRSTAQVIFSDLFNSFNMDILEGFAGQPYEDMGESRGTFNLGADIKAKLIAAGVPEKEIMVVTDQKDEALTNIFDKVNDGEIRVIIGSTGRLGVGVNIQERLAAVHHLMPPRDFKPAMMEQRNGRIIRQGNLHAEWRDIAFVDVVERLGKTRLPTKDDKGKALSPSKRAEAARKWLDDHDRFQWTKGGVRKPDSGIRAEAEAAARVFDIQIIEYGVEKSLDSAVYSMMSAKQGMIAQVLTADAVGNEFEDPSDEIRMSMAEMAAHTMGDPDMIRSVTVDKLFRELRAAYEGFQRMDSGRRSDVRRLSYNIEKSTTMLPRLDTEAERYGKLWEANEGKPVYEFGGITINTAEKDAKITAPLNLWITENAREMALKGQEERTASLTINGQPFNITVKGEEEAKDGEDGGVYGFVQMARSDRYTNFAGGARGAIQALHRITENAATRAADTRQELAKEQKQLAQIQAYLAQDKAFPRMEELQALQRERQELMQRINARNAPEPRPERDSNVRQGLTIPPLAQADPDLLTEEVMSALEDAVITDNSLVLPEQLDRKLYKAVNAALESAGGVWSKRDKAHLFAGDPRPYLGLAPMPSIGSTESPALAKGRVSVDTPNREPRTENREQDQLDRRTAHATRIAGSRVTAEQGQALRDDHFARLLTGALRPDSPAARSDFDWSPGPRLARLLSEAFSAPILTPAQQAAIHALPVNDDGVESMIYLDRENGVIYKKLKNYAEQPSGGIWPQVTWAGRSLSWHLQPANNPRAVGVRLAVMTDLGGTPTEVAAIGPEGHIYLKQPLSSAPKIATEKGSHITVSTRHLAGLVEIPDKHLEPGSARAWIGIVNGRPWLVTDLHPANFIGDNQGDARINDPVIGVISMDVLKNVPGLGAVVQEANRRAQDLGDRANRLFKGSIAPERSEPSVASAKDGPSPLAKLGWNHLDRSASAKLAALTRWTNDTTKAGELVAKWQSAPLAAPFMKWGHLLKKELFPDSVLPREIAAKKREMEIKTAMGGQRAMDLVRALSGSPKFSDIAYPPEFAANPIWRTRLYSAMTGEAPMSSLPPALQALAAKLRAMLVEIGQEAVKQGRMSLDTFEMLREGYMPHYYKEDVAREKSLIQRFRLAVRDLLGARTSAWHIVDTQNRERGSGDFRAVEWQPGKWRFRNKEHRDAHYEDFILSQALTQIHAMGGKARTLTVSDLRAPAALSGEVRGALDVIKRQLRTRYQKEAPLSLDAHQKAGLIMDPVYAIARYAAQQAHDNATAEFFNFVAANPENISDVAAAGFTEVPDNPRYGRLAGQYVTDDVAHQILEMIEVPGDALRAYDTILGWWKTGKTVLNPGTHVRNVLGNVFFSQLAGNSVWNPGNTRYYRDALRAMRNGGPDLMEAYNMGVLGADFVSVELRQTLRQLLPDPATIEEGKPVLGIGKSIGQFAAKIIGNPTHKAYNQIAALYQAEDELFKLAAYLKAKAIFAQQGTRNEELGTMAAGHVRKWFPYFDSGSSTTLRALGRTAMPFLGFYRESIRIFGHALAERPLALAAGLAVPSIITVLSAMALGLDDDELEQVRKDMRGKGAKLLGPTPLGGVPLFSMLLPERSDQGQLQQFDISAIHPFVDFMGNRVEGGENEDWYQKAWRSFIAAGPIGSLIYSQMTGKDTFGDRTFVEDNMTGAEKFAARLDNAAKTLLPPLSPGLPIDNPLTPGSDPGFLGGTGFQSLLNAGTRQTNKTFETRSPTQTVLRSVVGLDVRNATPNLYRIANDWRKANGYEVQEGMDYGSTTPASRARAALFSVLAQDEPNEKAIANIKKRLAEMGHPITSPQDVNKLLFYRDPLKIIGGDQKRNITAKEAQQQFQASLTGLDRETLAAAQAEYEKIKARAPMLLLR